MKEYAILRVCNKLDGTVACPVSTLDTETAAWKEYYRQLGLAVDSTHLTDAVMLLDKDGFLLDSRSFHHDPPAEE